LSKSTGRKASLVVDVSRRMIGSTAAVRRDVELTRIGGAPPAIGTPSLTLIASERRQLAQCLLDSLSIGHAVVGAATTTGAHAGFLDEPVRHEDAEPRNVDSLIDHPRHFLDDIAASELASTRFATRACVHAA
jgi:hypothetical protein